MSAIVKLTLAPINIINYVNDVLNFINKNTSFGLIKKYIILI